MRFLLFGIFFFVFATDVFAKKDPVIIRIGEQEISRSEFEYFFRHCADKDLDSRAFMQIFVDKRLKTLYAMNQGLDTLAEFTQAHGMFKRKIASSFILERLLPDSCVKAFYERKVKKEFAQSATILQIVKYLPQQASEDWIVRQSQWMDSIYASIQKQPQVDFAYWVNRFSDCKDESTVSNRQATSEMANMVFTLNEGEISPVFATSEGFHIVQLKHKGNIPPYESVRDSLREVLARTPIIYAHLDEVVADLKNRWNYIPFEEAMREALMTGHTDSPLFSINGQAYGCETLSEFLPKGENISLQRLEMFIAKSLLEYGCDHIEAYSSESAYALRLLDEDFLLSRITNKKVLSPSVNDKAGLSAYFRVRKTDYYWECPRFRGVVLHCKDKPTLKQALKLLKKSTLHTPEEVAQQLNTPGNERIRMECGLFAPGDNAYVDKLFFKLGSFEPMDSFPCVDIHGKKVKGPQDYKEIEDQVTQDYGAYLNKLWLEELRANYTVEIDKEVLKTVNNN